jgi:hypothetical protein
MIPGHGIGENEPWLARMVERAQEILVAPGAAGNQVFQIFSRLDRPRFPLLRVTIEKECMTQTGDGLVADLRQLLLAG